MAGWLEETLRVKVKAPPEKGMANQAVIRLLEKTLDVPKGTVKIIRGAASSGKVVEIFNCDEDRTMNKLRKC